MTRTALVLDGAAGPALAVTRSLGRAGWRVVTTSGTRAAASRYASGCVPLPHAEREPDAFADALRGLLARERFDVVAPCTDASVEHVWAARESLGETRVLGGDGRSAGLLLDKATSLAAAAEHGFPAPEWAAPATLAEARRALERVGLPAVVKPRRSYVRVGDRLVHRRHVFVTRPDELEAALASRTSEEGALPLIQALAPGRALSVTVVLRAGRVLALVARETLSFDPVAGGTSVWKRTIDPREHGVGEAVEFLRSFGYEGLGELEYQLGPDGVPRFMEVNPRPHGWIPLAVAAGVDVPLLAARAALGDDLPDAAPYRTGVQMRWPVGELNRLRAALARDPQLPPGTSRLDVLARMWPPWTPRMHYDGIDARDPVPMLPQRLRRTLGRRGRRI